MAGKIVLETSRLYLREMTEADAALCLSCSIPRAG
jgi:hypothetical protein